MPAVPGVREAGRAAADRVDPEIPTGSMGRMAFPARTDERAVLVPPARSQCPWIPLQNPTSIC